MWEQKVDRPRESICAASTTGWVELLVALVAPTVAQPDDWLKLIT